MGGGDFIWIFEILSKESADFIGRNRVKKLAELIPRQQFDIPIQAAIGSRILSRETVKALRKDVTAKLYGGDVTENEVHIYYRNSAYDKYQDSSISNFQIVSDQIASV